MNIHDKLDRILKHISNVQDKCKTIAFRSLKSKSTKFASWLEEEGLDKLNFSINLIHTSLSHDISKFSTEEFSYLILGDGDENDRLNAIRHHQINNRHHPEAWESVHHMPLYFIAEMVSDWAARSNEFNSSLTDWIDNEATKRFSFSKDDVVYEKIMFFVSLLSEKSF